MLDLFWFYEDSENKEKIKARTGRGTTTARPNSQICSIHCVKDMKLLETTTAVKCLRDYYFI